MAVPEQGCKYGKHNGVHETWPLIGVKIMKWLNNKEFKIQTWAPAAFSNAHRPVSTNSRTILVRDVEFGMKFLKR